MTAAAINAALDRVPGLPLPDRLREIERLQRALRWLEAADLAAFMGKLLRCDPKHRPTNREIGYCRSTTRRMVLTTRVGVETTEHHLSRRRKALRT